MTLLYSYSYDYSEAKFPNFSIFSPQNGWIILLSYFPEMDFFLDFQPLLYKSTKFPTYIKLWLGMT